MKICILSPIYPISTDQRLGIFVHEQAKYLAKAGNEVYVITLGSSKDKDFEIREGVSVHRIKSNKSLFGRMHFSLAIIKKLIELNKKINFDIVHFHFVGPLTAFIGLTSKLIRKPFVITAHGIGLLSENPLRRLMTMHYLSYPSHIICVSSYVAELASRYAENEKIVVINNGIDPEKLKPGNTTSFKKKLGIKKEKILLSVAGLVQRKGIDIILKAMPEIIKSYPNVKYIVVGKGPEKENFKQLASRLGISNHIIFIDYAGDKDLANLYSICDIFILMSKTIKEKEGIEGFGIVYIEASYFGKPVIGGKSGGTADSIINNVTGYRIEPDNIDELIDKVLMLLNNERLRRKLGNEGMKRVKSQLLWKHAAEKLVQVYKTAMK